MKTIILKEGVLNDDTLYIADEGKVFGGGYIAIVEMWEFETTNSNRKVTRGFRKPSTLDKFINKHYPNTGVFYDATIRWNDTGDVETYLIKQGDVNELYDDEVFYYIESEEELDELKRPNGNDWVLLEAIKLTV